MKLYCQKCDKVFDAGKAAGEVPCPSCSTGIKIPDKFPGPGAVIGDFLIEKPISSGGMGEVFAARQISLDRPAALKVLQGEYTNDREYVDGLFREARAAARINHPNIVQAYAVGEDDGVFYFAMELVRGDTLKAVLKREKVLAPDRAAKVICDIAKALDTAWREQKLVHQDIKPDNIMWDNSSKLAKLADLGIAKTATMDPGDEDADEVLGTPQYISPEQLTGIPTDVRSDIYSLGATFFHFVTGRFPYVAPTAEELAHLHNAGNLEPPQKFNPQVPDEINRIIMKMMARQLTDRYQTPAELINDLEAFLRDFAAGKIVIPQKKAEKIAPVVPKLAVPGKKAVPQSSPAVPPPPSISLPKAPSAPVKPLAVPPAKPPVSPVSPGKPPVENAAGKVDDSENAENVRKIKFTVPAGVWKISGIVLAVLTIVVILAAGGLYFGAKYKKLPSSLRGMAEKLYGKFDAETKQSPAGKNDAGANAAVVEEKKPPVIRAEYKAAVDQVGNSVADLKKVDAVWEVLSVPVTPEENKLFAVISARFAAADENSRCAEGREALRNKFLQNRDAEKQAQLQALREAERIKQENALNQQKIDAERRAEEERQREHIRKIKSNISAHINKCATAMIAAAFDEKDTAFDSALSQAKLYNDTLFGFSADETRLKDQMQNLIGSMPAELAKLRAAFRKIASVNSSHEIMFRIGRRKWYVVSIKPGMLLCRNDNGGVMETAVDKLNERSQKELFKELTNVMGIDNPEFYLKLYDRQIPGAADAPDGFWKECFSLM